MLAGHQGALALNLPRRPMRSRPLLKRQARNLVCFLVCSYRSRYMAWTDLDVHVPGNELRNKPKPSILNRASLHPRDKLPTTLTSKPLSPKPYTVNPLFLSLNCKGGPKSLDQPLCPKSTIQTMGPQQASTMQHVQTKGPPRIVNKQTRLARGPYWGPFLRT